MIQTLSTSFPTGRVSRGDGTMAPPDRSGHGMDFSAEVIERYTE
jgi:L-alanine-DL-glutamate epimerase-like enolase superfamily enzyme